MKKRYLKLVRRAFRSMRHPRLRHQQWWQTLTKPVANRDLWIPCRDTVANGVTIGVFFSMIVVLPFQMLFAAVVAMLARANIPLAMACCWLSNLITSVPLVYLQSSLGKWIRSHVYVPMPEFIQKGVIKLPGIGNFDAANYLVGMASSAIILALASYVFVHILAKWMPQHLPVRKKRLPGEDPKNPSWQPGDPHEPSSHDGSPPL